MAVLHHHPLSPLSRAARLLLAEKGVAFSLQLEKPWEARAEFLSLSPGGDVPVYVGDDGFVVNEGLTLLEYIEESVPSPPFLGKEVKTRAATRQLAHFFARLFARDVVESLVNEKAMKRITGQGVPDAFAIRRGYAALAEHMKYINWLADQNKWLAGNDLSLADLMAAAHLSVIDYLGDIPWDRFPEAKNWYARLKSRPSFRPLLADHIPGLPPPLHYANLDF